jgi:hypothetical protein
LIDVRAYARLMAELAAGGPRGRAATLLRHGLDEDAWTEIDDRWQAELSAALGPFDDEPGALLAEYAAAYEAAQRELAAPVSLEAFAEVTRLVQANGDLVAALARGRMKMSDFVQANAHFSKAMIEDPEIEARFAALLARRGTL